MKKKKGQYRFFYHYYKQYKCMSVHFRGACHRVDDVICMVPAETKWSKTQPNLKVQGWARGVEFKNNKAYIK